MKYYKLFDRYFSLNSQLKSPNLFIEIFKIYLLVSFLFHSLNSVSLLFVENSSFQYPSRNHFLYTVQSVLHLLALAFSQEDILVYFKCLELLFCHKMHSSREIKYLWFRPISQEMQRNAYNHGVTLPTASFNGDFHN